MRKPKKKHFCWKKKPYAYSTDSEKNAKKKAKEDKKALNSNQFQQKKSSISQKLNEISIDPNENLVNTYGEKIRI